MGNTAAAYKRLIKRFVKWAKTETNIRAAIIIGSRARVDHPADDWSDLDLLSSLCRIDLPWYTVALDRRQEMEMRYCWLVCSSIARRSAFVNRPRSQKLIPTRSFQPHWLPKTEPRNKQKRRSKLPNPTSRNEVGFCETLIRLGCFEEISEK